MQRGIPAAEVLQSLGMIDGRTIPDHKDVPAQMLEQILEEALYLIERDVLGMEPEVEPQPMALGADRQIADH